MELDKMFLCYVQWLLAGHVVHEQNRKLGAATL